MSDTLLAVSANNDDFIEFFGLLGQQAWLDT